MPTTQSQASVTDQLFALLVVANEAGLYDASDWVANRMRERRVGMTVEE